MSVFPKILERAHQIVNGEPESQRAEGRSLADAWSAPIEENHLDINANPGRASEFGESSSVFEVMEEIRNLDRPVTLEGNGVVKILSPKPQPHIGEVVSVTKVAAAIMKAAPEMSEDQALEIAGNLSKKSLGEWIFGGSDGMIPVHGSYSLEDNRRTNSIIENSISNQETQAAVRKAVDKLITTNEQPLPPADVKPDASDEPVLIVEEDFLPVIQKAETIPLGIACWAGLLQDLAPLTANYEELIPFVDFFKDLVTKTVMLKLEGSERLAAMHGQRDADIGVSWDVVHVRQMITRLNGGGLLTKDDLDRLSRMRMYGERLSKIADGEIIVPRNTSKALTQMSSLASYVRIAADSAARAGASMRSASFAVSQMAPRTRHPVAAAVMLVGAGVMAVASLACMISSTALYASSRSSEETAAPRVVYVVPEILITAEPDPKPINPTDHPLIPEGRAEGTRTTGPNHSKR